MKLAKNNQKRPENYYTLNFPQKLRYFYEAYITMFDYLGFNKVSQVCTHILQKNAEKLIEKYPELLELAKAIQEGAEKVVLHSGTYVLDKKTGGYVNKTHLLFHFPF